MSAFSIPASATAFLAAPTAKCVWRPWYFQSSGFSPTSETSQLRTSAEILVGKLLASNRLMYPMPDSPFSKRRHVVSISEPRGVTHPIPVTTTRRLIAPLLGYTALRPARLFRFSRAGQPRRFDQRRAVGGTPHLEDAQNPHGLRQI